MVDSFALSIIDILQIFVSGHAVATCCKVSFLAKSLSFSRSPAFATVAFCGIASVRKTVLPPVLSFLLTGFSMPLLTPFIALLPFSVGIQKPLLFLLMRNLTNVLPYFKQFQAC